MIDAALVDKLRFQTKTPPMATASGRSRFTLRAGRAAGWQDTTETAKLTASDGQMNDQLGSRVAIWGDTVFAGAPGRSAAYGLDKPRWLENHIAVQNSRFYTVPDLQAVSAVTFMDSKSGTLLMAGNRSLESGAFSAISPQLCVSGRFRLSQRYRPCRHEPGWARRPLRRLYC